MDIALCPHAPPALVGNQWPRGNRSKPTCYSDHLRPDRSFRPRRPKHGISDTTQVGRQGKGYFTDDHGNPSSMRIMSFLALLVAAALACVEVLGWGSGESKTELVLYFLVAAFAPKAVQKFAEGK